MFEAFFVVWEWASGLWKGDMVSSFEKALDAYSDMDKFNPTCALIYKTRREDDGHTHLFGYNFTAKDWCDEGPIYFVVRQDAGLWFPETVICENGIFNNMEDADRYVEKHGGEWKIYSWKQLLSKLDEQTVSWP